LFRAGSIARAQREPQILRKVAHRPADRWVVGGDDPAARKHEPRERDRRGLAGIRRVALERETEERDADVAAIGELALEERKESVKLLIVLLDHGAQEREVVALVIREGLQRADVLREARAAPADAGAVDEIAADDPLLRTMFFNFANNDEQAIVKRGC